MKIRNENLWRLPLSHVVMAAVLSASLAGCATMDEAIENVKASSATRSYPTVSNTVKQGCAGGAVIGVLYQAHKSKDKDKNSTDSTWVKWREKVKDATKGGAVGGLIGCTAAAALDIRRQNSANAADFYEKEIQVTSNLNRQLADVNAHLESRTAENRRLYTQLEQQKKAATLTSETAGDARRTARSDLSWAREQLDTAKSNLEAQKLVSNDTSRGKIDAVQADRLNAELKSLETHVTSLEREIADLSMINDAIGQFQG